MKKYDIKDIPKEVLAVIEMRYDDWNYELSESIASMYDSIEIDDDTCTIQDIRDLERAEKLYKENLIQDYLAGKLVYTEEELERAKNYWHWYKGE